MRGPITRLHELLSWLVFPTVILALLVAGCATPTAERRFEMTAPRTQVNSRTSTNVPAVNQQAVRQNTASPRKSASRQEMASSRRESVSPAKAVGRPSVTHVAHQEPIGGTEPLEEIESRVDESLISMAELPRSNAPFEAQAEFTIDQLEQLALANNPTVQQSLAVVDKAFGVQTQVGLPPNPTVGYFSAEMGDEGTAGKQGAFVRQTFVTGGKLGQNRIVADREARHLQVQLQAQQIRVRNAVRSQFYKTLGAQQQVEIATQLLEIAEQGVAASQQLLDAQQTALPDLLQAQIQRSEVAILLRNAEYEYEAAWEQLTSLVGQPDMSPAKLVGSLESETIAADELDQRFAEMLAMSPEIQAAQARVELAAAQVDRQVLQPIPNLMGQLNVAHDNASGNDIASLQVGVPLPILNANEGGIRLAQADYQRAIHDLRRIELSLRNRWAQVVRDYRQAANQVARYREDILPMAQENVELTQEGYKQSEFDLIRALTARQSYFQSSLAYVEAKIAQRQSEVAITGFLLEGGLNDVQDTQGANLKGLGLRSQSLGGQ